MDELVQKIVDEYGYPADMVMRSAQARAQADGTSVEAVLAAWTGGEAPAAAAAPAADAPAAAPAAAPARHREPPLMAATMMVLAIGCGALSLLMLGGLDSPLLIGPAHAALSAGQFGF